MSWSWAVVLSPLVSYSHFCYLLAAQHMLLISSMDDMGNKNVEVVLNMFQMDTATQYQTRLGLH